MSTRKSTLADVKARLTEIPGMSDLMEREYAVLIAEEHANSQIAALVRKARVDAHLSQTELGARIGVSQARISEIEQGGSSVYGTSVVLLARLFKACGHTLRLSAG